jgi:rhamnogalacturonyl hydrolase YesR
MQLHLLTLSALILNVLAHPNPQNGSLSYSLQMANSIISRHQGVLKSSTDSSNMLQAGFTQKAFRQIIQQYPTHPLAPTYASYIQSSINSVIPALSNATLDTTAFSLDRLSSGNGLIYAYQETGNESYRIALETLVKSIDLQPKNAEGSLWYYVYPNYTYLDGMYSLAPFATLYTNTSHSPIVNVSYQLERAWAHTYHPSSGLNVHGYDASKRAVWADASTGASPHVWGRSLGWFSMALIDTLELMSSSQLLNSNTSTSEKLIKRYFTHLMSRVVDAADPATGAWWQVMDEPERKGNYVESSASAMFVYSLLKGVRLGYLGADSWGNAEYVKVARRAYEYMVDTWVVQNGNGTLGWNGTVSVCSLNSSASFEVCITRKTFPQWGADTSILVLCWTTIVVQQCFGFGVFCVGVAGVREARLVMIFVRARGSFLNDDCQRTKGSIANGVCGDDQNSRFVVFYYYRAARPIYAMPLIQPGYRYTDKIMCPSNKCFCHMPIA